MKRFLFIFALLFSVSSFAQTQGFFHVIKTKVPKGSPSFIKDCEEVDLKLTSPQIVRDDSGKPIGEVAIPVGREAIGVVHQIHVSLKDKVFSCGYERPVGQELSKAEYSDLSSIFKCTYGCSKDKFKILDLRGLFEKG